MSFTFSELIEEIRQRPTDEQVEIKEIIEHDLIENERARMHRNHLESMREWEEGKIQPAASVDELIKRLEK